MGRLGANVLAKKRIGIFGGTFNPIHNGHIKMAEAARKEYKLDCVCFIPCGIPPHKQKNKLLPAKLRYDLVKKAIKNKRYFKVLDIEIKKRKPCYTIDTVKKLVGAYRGKPSWYFLIGQDSFESLHTWNKANELVRIVTFLVLPRDGKNRELGKRRTGEIKVPKVKNLRWCMVHTKPVDISGKEIRQRIKNSLLIQGLVPGNIKESLRKISIH